MPSHLAPHLLPIAIAWNSLFMRPWILMMDFKPRSTKWEVILKLEITFSLNRIQPSRVRLSTAPQQFDPPPQLILPKEHACSFVSKSVAEGDL